MLLPPGRGMSQMEHIPLGMVPGWDLGTRLYTAPSIARGAGPAANQQVPGATQGFPPKKITSNSTDCAQTSFPSYQLLGKVFLLGWLCQTARGAGPCPSPPPATV